MRLDNGGWDEERQEERTQDGKEDVDEEVGTAATLEEDTHGREDDGKEDLADIAIRRVLVGIILVIVQSTTTTRVSLPELPTVAMLRQP